MRQQVTEQSGTVTKPGKGVNLILGETDVTVSQHNVVRNITVRKQDRTTIVQILGTEKRIPNWVKKYFCSQIIVLR